MGNQTILWTKMIMNNASYFYIKQNNLFDRINKLEFEEEEMITFLNQAWWKQVFVKETFENETKVSIYEKWKSFLVPNEYFIEEEENDSEIEEKAGFFNTLRKYFDYKVNFFLIVFIFLWFLAFVILDPFSFKRESEAMEIQPTAKTIYEIEHEKQNENNLLIIQELEKQKTLRDEKRKIDEIINQSKEKVKNLEEENRKSRLIQIQEAQ